MKKNVIASLIVSISLTAAVFATPSTQIWNPSTDIQGLGSIHFGIDNYFAKEGVIGPASAYATDLGLTYGLLPGLEIGVDAFLPQNSPFMLNAKYGIAEGSLPAVAIGVFGFGTEKGVTDQNVVYAVIAKTFPLGRLSAGCFSGNSVVIGADNSGVILTWDKALTDKIWACLDYSGSNSTLGATYAGLSYAFSANTSVIFGYGKYNNGSTPMFTTQLDINI